MFIYYVAVNFKSQRVNSGLNQEDAIVNHTLIFKANFCQSARVNVQGIWYYATTIFKSSS
jgi:hypothetical protein